MAQVYPDLEFIKKAKVKPTDGEMRLLKFLIDNLDNSFEIYFQPLLNGDNPDIIVMRKNSGVLIIEVKDWQLQYYRCDGNNLFLKTENTQISSPFEQVKKYKDNLINLHIPGLLEKTVKAKAYYGIIVCAVYFYNESQQKASNFFHDYDKHILILGNDSLTVDKFQFFLNTTKLNRNSKIFNQYIYDEFKKLLSPPLHLRENGREIFYSKEQKLLISSKANDKQKIKGVAGSGKTLVLAKRAVDAHKRTNDKVLILTFNITLINYIHDRISDVREEFKWDNFIISNYHMFFLSEANNHNLKILNVEQFENTNFFEYVKEKIQKFSAIFIDEVQDYETEWLEIITKYFLSTDGEFVVFGDEKQNIYDRKLNNEKEPIIKSIVGRWNKSLTAPQRFHDKIAIIAQDFQFTFFRDKYYFDEYSLSQNPIDFNDSLIDYYFIDGKSSKEVICDLILDIMQKHSVHPSDVAIINSQIDYIRELDYIYRAKTGRKTKTTFETKEIYDFLQQQCTLNNTKILKKDLEDIRRNKKYNFWLGSGTIKLSTTHSFKGWEISSLFLLIETPDPQTHQQTNTDELVYTGLTRARQNLFVINIGNTKYHNFFNEHINNS